MFSKMQKYLKKPDLYEESSMKFWDDIHISKNMLEAHLNPDWEAASRKHDFIDASVKFINDNYPSKNYERVLDLGCGPGLYTERLYNRGYSITGIDFSKRSIEYARKKAEENGYAIEYIYENYLEVDYKNEFDLILLIYCDYGALSDKQRNIMLRKVYDALKIGGRFIVDVFTEKNYEDKKEKKTWSINEGSGFWKPNSHLCLEANYIYENNTRLNQYVIMDNEENVDVVRIWDHYYTKESLTEELLMAGFKNIEIYSDVAGNPYSDDSKTICAIVEK